MRERLPRRQRLPSPREVEDWDWEDSALIPQEVVLPPRTEPEEMVPQEVVLPPCEAPYASEGDQDRTGQLANERRPAKSEYHRPAESFNCLEVFGTTVLQESQALRNLRYRSS